MTDVSRTPDERRFALLAFIRNATPTMADIKRLPAYVGITERNLTRYIERDLQRLRETGYVIHVDDLGRYHLDTSGNISVDCSGVELGILRSLLGAKGKTSPFIAAQHAVTKILSSGEVSSRAAHLTVHTPKGEQAVPIAAAIQRRKRIQFSYRSLHADAPSVYVVEPFRLEIHFDAYYLRGYQVATQGRSSHGYRTYKLDRIVREVTTLDDAVTHSLPDDVLSDLTPVTATVRLARPLPLMSQAAEVRRSDAGIDITLVNIDRSDLYADLMFYGLDAELTGPPDVREDFYRRVRHMADLGQVTDD